MRLQPQRNCWRIERAHQVAVLIDAEAYFSALYHALCAAERQIIICGWDFDSRLVLRRGSMHEKLVVVDDSIAFCGGLDLCDVRWDGRAHAPVDPRRLDVRGHLHPPHHDDHLFGNAMLSRWPLQGTRRLELGGLEPRCALAVSLRLGPEDLWVVGTHLGLGCESGVDRPNACSPGCARSTCTASWWPATSTPGCPGPMRTLVLARAFGRCLAPRSFPAWRPLFRFDRVFAHASLLTGPVCIHETSLARVGSDHLPVVASLAVPIDDAVPADPEDTNGSVVVLHRHAQS